MVRWIGGLVALLCAAGPASAQTDAVVTAPPNLVLSNYNSVPVGPFGGLEGSAYVARVGDPSAAWFNPAGLARKESPQISGSAGVYQLTSVTPEQLPSTGGSFRQLPAFVGFTFNPSRSVTAGAALITTNSWNQETNAELITTIQDGKERFAYSADSDYERLVLALALGYHGDQSPWRFGGGLAISEMNLRLVQTASDRVATSTGLQSLLVAARSSATVFQVRSQMGVQYDATHWQFGAAVRTPGATVHRSGEVTFDGLLDAGTSSTGASVFDPNATSEYHLPWEFQGGAAFVSGRAEAEVDVQTYSSIKPYSLVSTSNPTLVYTDAGNGQPPGVSSRPFGGLTTASGSVVDVSGGGALRLISGRNLRLHAGVASNRSPVAAEDEIFTKVDLVTWTVGLSGSLGKFQFAAGFNHQSGRADNVMLRNLINGRAVTANIDMSMSGFIYAVAYQF
jgi:hypothetical protein